MTRCSNCGGTAIAPAIDNAGQPYVGCARCTLRYLPRFSLQKLAAAQRRIAEVASDPSFVHPFTAEQLAMMSYALGVLSAERLADGETLADPEEPA
jgi:hypothetical protein